MTEVDDFARAFSHFMNSGNKEVMAEYCQAGANLDFLNIYRNGYLRSGINALASNYPTLIGVLGEGAFREMAKEYMSRYPPSSGSLVGYGGLLPMYLQSSEHVREYPFLLALAQMDRAWTTVYFSRDINLLSPCEIFSALRLSPDETHKNLSLTSSMELLTLQYSVSNLWVALKSNASLGGEVSIPCESESVLLWRQGETIQLRVLPPHEYQFIFSLKAGKSLVSCCEYWGENAEDVDLGDFLASLISENILIISNK